MRLPNQGILKGEVSLYRWPPVWLVWISLFFWAYPSGPFSAVSCFAKIRLAWEWMTLANTLAYYSTILTAFFIFHRHQGPILWNIFICNLRIFVISQSVCPWQAFPAESNVGMNLSYSRTPERCFTQVGSGLPANIRLSWKRLPLTNTLAYYENSFY